MAVESVGSFYQLGLNKVIVKRKTAPPPWAVSIIHELDFKITVTKGAMHFISKHLWSYFFYKLQFGFNKSAFDIKLLASAYLVSVPQADE